MQQILNQLWIALVAIAKLLWIVVRAVWQLLAGVAGYIYRHRVQIIQYRYTLSIVMLLSVLWAGWRMYSHFSHPEPAEEVVTIEEAQPVSFGNGEQRYAVLTSDDSPDTSSNTALITSIYSWLGTPHRDGGTSLKGTDCSNFVQSVYKDAYGIQLNRNSQKMYEEDVEVIPKTDLREGDLVFFSTMGLGVSHVGIYLKNGMFVHASTSKGVIVESLSSPYYQKNYYGSGRVKRKG